MIQLISLYFTTFVVHKPLIFWRRNDTMFLNSSPTFPVKSNTKKAPGIKEYTWCQPNEGPSFLTVCQSMFFIQ